MSISRFKKLFSSCIFLFVLILGFIHFEQLTFHVEAKNEADNDVFLPFVLSPWVAIPSEMVFVPAGEFQMGCDKSNLNEHCSTYDLPIKSVYLDAYYIDKYEVTNAQYASFLNQKKNNDCGGYLCININNFDSRIDFKNGQYVVDEGFEDHPVYLVTWFGADEYCPISNGRLPTEAEWEKAARGSNDARIFPWGDLYPDCTYLNFKDGPTNCIGEPVQVGSYLAGASPYGLMDMSGNVAEWVFDVYEPLSANQNLTKQSVNADWVKVLHGGSWDTSWDSARVAHSTSISDPTFTNTSFGFRCAASIK